MNDFGGLHIVDADVPLANLLAATDRFVTHLSSSIVEAVILDVPTLMVKVEDTGVWPRWDRFGAYLQVEERELNRALPKFLTTGPRPPGYHVGARDSFIREFRYRADEGACGRIADSALQIIGDSPWNA